MQKHILVQRYFLFTIKKNLHGLNLILCPISLGEYYQHSGLQASSFFYFTKLFTGWEEAHCPAAAFQEFLQGVLKSMYGEVCKFSPVVIR